MADMTQDELIRKMTGRAVNGTTNAVTANIYRAGIAGAKHKT